MKIMSFDVESNGLHGEAFAVAGVLVETDGRLVDTFLARCPIPGPVDPWVAQNVLGPMEHIAQTHQNAYALRAAFWAWFVPAKAQAEIVVCANPYPVEARFLIQCQDDDLSERQLHHPFPLYDLSSMLLTLGHDTRAKRHSFIEQHVELPDGQAHDPLWDTTVTARAALQAIHVSRKKEH
jgi:hypothetical protein